MRIIAKEQDGENHCKEASGVGDCLRAARLSGIEDGGFWLNRLSRIPAGLGCAGLRRGPRRRGRVERRPQEPPEAGAGGVSVCL